MCKLISTQHNPTFSQKLPDSTIAKFLWCLPSSKMTKINTKNDYANTLSTSVWAPKTPLISNFHQIGWLCLHLFLGLRAGYPHTRMQKWRHTICSAVTKVLCNMTVLVSSRWPVCYFLKKRMCPRKLIHFKYNLMHLTGCAYCYFSLSPVHLQWNKNISNGQ